MTEEPPKPKELTDMGMRYTHLVDMREIWQNGLETINRIKPQYLSKADEVLRTSLESAISLVDKQLDLMSKIDIKKYELKKVIDGL